MKKRTGKKPASSRRGSAARLAVTRPNVAGIDIGSREMYVCAPVSTDGATEVRAFATTTGEIQACAAWLHELQVESVAMESTGVYWIPVLEILEGSGFETLLVDTRPLSRVPGRKTDVTDAEWIQTLHSHGLLQSSYRPTDEITQLRSLTRQKTVLVAEQADWLRRIQKCLDQMNVRVHHAVADVQGTTGMQIIRAIVAGERDPQKLAEFRDPRCRKSQVQIAEHLRGHWRPDHLFNLQEALKTYDFLLAQIGVYEEEIRRRMGQLTPPGASDKQAPPLPSREKRKAMKRRDQEDKRQALYRMVGCDLTTIDGIGVETAETVISEYGTELSQFAGEKQFVAHLKLAPRQAITGGKPIRQRRGQTKTTRSACVLRNAAATLRNSPTAIGAYYRRVSRSKGAKVAVFATARKLATLIYRMLRWGQEYVDIGQQAYEERYRHLRLRALATTAAQYGYSLAKIEPVTA